MAKDIWVSSDWHYNHANILTFYDYNGKKVREFDNVNQMNECLIDNHNSVVKPGDIFYNLGDVFMGDKEKFKRDFPKFNGSKRLVVGNHDDIKFLSSGGFFNNVLMWRGFPEYGLILSHVPLNEGSLFRGKDLLKPALNVHGHIHTLDSPPGPYYNVSVERINYTPVHIEDLAVKARKMQEEWLNEKERSDSLLGRLKRYFG